MTSASKGHFRKGSLEKIVQIFAASRKGHCFGGASKQDFKEGKRLQPTAAGEYRYR